MRENIELRDFGETVGFGPTRPMRDDREFVRNEEGRVIGTRLIGPRNNEMPVFGNAGEPGTVSGTDSRTHRSSDPGDLTARKWGL